MKIKGKFMHNFNVIDPDTKGLVELEVYKLANGSIIAIDSSFIETELPVYSPFDKNIEIDPEIFG